MATAKKRTPSANAFERVPYAAKPEFPYWKLALIRACKNALCGSDLSRTRHAIEKSLGFPVPPAMLEAANGLEIRIGVFVGRNKKRQELPGHVPVDSRGRPRKMEPEGDCAW